jgi:hypothetical protein
MQWNETRPFLIYDLLPMMLQGSLRAVAFAPDGNFAVSSGSGEMAVAVWATSGSKKAKKLGGVAVTQMAVPAPVVQLHTTG